MHVVGAVVGAVVVLAQVVRVAGAAQVDQLLAGVVAVWVGGVGVAWSCWVLRSRAASIERYGPLAEPQKVPWVMSDGYHRWNRRIAWGVVVIGVARIATAALQAIVGVLG
jgi:hypothetical protein